MSELTDKVALRRALRVARAAAARDGSVVVPDWFGEHVSARCVASYSPEGDEADPAPLALAAAAAGCGLALPYFADRDAPLCFRLWHKRAALEPGPFGHPQPIAAAPLAAPDVLLTPLLGFDRRGGRIGQGRGHYDRAFAGFPDVWRIGIAWSAQEVAAVPMDRWDVRLHAIATEREWITAA